MISVIVSEINDEKKISIFDKADINHLKNVFRVKVGDEVRAVDGEKEYYCKIEQITKECITLMIEKVYEDSFSLKVEIDAGIGVLRNDKMDLTVQKLTELGIRKIIPLSTKRGIVRLKEKKGKWDLIVKETLKQCRGVKPTLIDEVKSLKEINFEEYDLVIVPYECENEKSLKSVMNENLEIRKILYIIGAEGGFEKSEIEYLEDKGAKIVTLGKRILRAETASIVVGGVLVNEFQ